MKKVAIRGSASGCDAAIISGNIRDVPLPETKDGIPPQLKNLVRALIAFGFETTGSCEGHMWHERNEAIDNYYPYVHIRSSDEGRIHRLWHVIDAFNESDAVKWGIYMSPKDRAAISICCEPDPVVDRAMDAEDKRSLARLQSTRDLKVMRGSADRLARSIFYSELARRKEG